MRLTFFVVWKSWVSNPVRTVLTVLGVALGIAVVTSIHVLDHNTIQSRMQQRIGDYGRVDLELLPKDADRVPDEVRRQLAGMTGLVESVGLLHGGASGAPVLADEGFNTQVDPVCGGQANRNGRPNPTHQVQDGKERQEAPPGEAARHQKLLPGLQTVCPLAFLIRHLPSFPSVPSAWGCWPG